MKDVWVVVPFGGQEVRFNETIFCQDRDHAVAVQIMIGGSASIYVFTDQMLLADTLKGLVCQYYDHETGVYGTFHLATYEEFARSVQTAYAAWEAGQ